MFFAIGLVVAIALLIIALGYESSSQKAFVLKPGQNDAGQASVDFLKQYRRTKNPAEKYSLGDTQWQFMEQRQRKLVCAWSAIAIFALGILLTFVF